MEVKVWIIIICSLVALCHCAPAQDDNAARAKRRRGCSSPKAQPGTVYYKGCTKFECKKKRRKFVWDQRLDSGVCCIVGNKGFLVGSVISSNSTADICTISTLTCRNIGHLPSLVYQYQDNQCNNEELLELHANLTGEGMIPPAVSEISDSVVQPVGCPSKIPITENGAIVAGKTYDGKGNNVPELSCNGKSKLWYKDTKYDAGWFLVLFGSVIVNPGCTLILVTPWQSKRLTGPTTIPNPTPNAVPFLGGTIYNCGGIPCVWTLIWTCKQTYPSCTPGDKWQIITKLDNSANITAQFTYEKIVGTEWSQSMTESRSVSTTVSADISLAFWKVTATMGISHKTGYDWKTTDTKTKSEIHSFKVSVPVPPKSTFTIEAVVGFCGGSKIHTQMFRILDSDNVILRTYQGAITSYDLTE